MNVLIISYENMVGETLKSLLEEQFPDLQVIARNLATGLKSLKEQNFNIVFCDRAFAGVDDTTGIKVFRKTDPAKTSFVLMTSLTASGNLVDYAQAGIRYVLEKPIDMVVAKLVIETILQQENQPDHIALFSRPTLF